MSAYSESRADFARARWRAHHFNRVERTSHPRKIQPRGTLFVLACTGLRDMTLSVARAARLAQGLLERGTMADTTQWQGSERRTNLRLRALIDELRGELRDTRHALEFLRERVSTLSVEMEELRRAHNEGRPAVIRAEGGAAR
jgi:hypothetical protein